MIADRRVIPFRPLPDPLPDRFFDFLDAVEGLPDATVMRLIDHHFPEAGAFLREPPMRMAPSEQMIRRAVAVRETVSRPMAGEVGDG